MTDIFLDWEAFWGRETHEAEWLYEPILARGRGHAIYAWQKTGKSLLTLGLAADLALNPDNLVIYLDYEMSEDDVYDRLCDMGYEAHTDFSRFRYALLPSLPPLDTREGSRALLQVIAEEQAAWPDCHLVVILDTMSRAVSGEESDADTIRDFYRFTGLKLKQLGATWARLDHAGKDPVKGQRGTSAKGDDVDIVWSLEKAEDGFLLKRNAARMSWVPEKVAVRILHEPLRFETVKSVLPAGTHELVAILDGLGLACESSVRDTRRALKEAGGTARQETLAAAVRIRKCFGNTSKVLPAATSGNDRGNTR